MIDLVKINVKGGAGGNGCISFRREKFVPRGGPDGGDGGSGGSIHIVVDSSLNTLLHLKYHSTWRAKRGAHGRGKKQRGANSEGIDIPVPPGTIVWKLADDESREFVADIVDTEPLLVARGGGGGAGNARFVSSTQQEPVLAEKGSEGEEAILILELKLLADVGLVGVPNGGKSTMLSRCSAAKPKIAPYPFTTTDPVLGVVASRDRSFVMMEVPGLIEGAHEGAGLGHEFLRHAERSRLFLHIIDGMAEDPVADWEQINHELVSFNPTLSEKSQFIVVNKVDIPEVRERAPTLKEELSARGLPLFFVSAATGEGVEELLGKVLETLDVMPKEDPMPAPERPSMAVNADEEPFRVTFSKGVYTIHAPRVERLVPLADLRDWKAMIQIWKELERLGVVKVLEEKGVKPGDTVRLGKVELEWF